MVNFKALRERKKAPEPHDPDRCANCKSWQGRGGLLCTICGHRLDVPLSECDCTICINGLPDTVTGDEF